MVTLFLLMPVVALFIAVNVLVGCYLTIRLGYGPPNWQTALNLVVRVTVLQNRLNALRDWLTIKIPQIDKLLNHLKVPNPVVIVDTSVQEETAEDTDDAPFHELAAPSIEELLGESRIASPQSESEPTFSDPLLNSALSSQTTASWFMNDKNAETSLLKLNSVLMKSGRFAAELEGHIRASLGTITAEELKKIIASFKDDCQKYLSSQSEIVQEVIHRIDEFEEFKALAEEITEVHSAHVNIIESVLKDIGGLDNRPPKEGAMWILQELAALRRGRHQLKDMRERVFSLMAAKEHRFDTIPKQLFVDELFGLRGRIGLMATLYGWWNAGQQKGNVLTFALVDFVKFGELNDVHGILTGDKIIHHFVNVLKEQFDEGDLLGIYYGNAFLAVTVKAGLQKTVTTVEHIRQKQMKTTYQDKGNEQSIQVLLTGAIVESSGEQSIEEVLARLDTTMAAAKSAGRNHTFCWNIGATQPEKTESPDFHDPEYNILFE